MTFARAGGVLLHPTSLPGPFGIGDLGPAAHDFLDRLVRAGQSVWQVLPLGPTGYGSSPYQSLSAFAMSPLLVAPERLREAGLASPDDLASLARASMHADLAAAAAERHRLLRRAHDRHRAGDGSEAPARAARFAAFQEAHARWLDDYALYAALKEAHAGRAWTDWPEPLRRREAGALARARDEHADSIERAAFAQFLAHEQWDHVRSAARERAIAVLGDVPIFVAHDSADVWANQATFDLDGSGLPRVVAGVPPDYFSETGQLWGNPHYRWIDLAARGYDWWIDRMRHALAAFDRVRVDHFRGFQASWEVPAGESTSIPGRWVDGPGRALFDALSAALGTKTEDLPIVAEDLGEITPEVHRLRDELGFPGMRVLQFGFGESPRTEIHAPHNFVRNCVAYTGTHDNDTTVGWFRGSGGDRRTTEDVSAEQSRVLRYTGTDGREIHWDMIRLLAQSVADTAIVPMQDVLGLGSEARMNTPGRSSGNWEWRLPGFDAAFHASMERLAAITEATGRRPTPAPPLPPPPSPSAETGPAGPTPPD
jgi:4-alpha-glucanotransferase